MISALKCLVTCRLASAGCNLYLYLCAFFQDDATGLLHGHAACVEVAAGPALVPSSSSHSDLLPGKWRMELSGHFCQNTWQRFTVSMETIIFCQIQLNMEILLIYLK